MPSAYVVQLKGTRRAKFALKVYQGDGKFKWLGGCFRTRAAALDWIASNLASHPVSAANLGLNGDRRLRAGKFLAGWLDHRRRDGTLRQRTWERYDELARIHVVPELGHLPLARVGSQQIKAMLTHRLEAGASPRTVRHVFALVHKAFEDAKFEKLVAQNPCDHVRPPQVPRYEPAIWDEKQTVEFLDQARRRSRFPEFWLLMLSTGLRLGEGQAVRLRDLDFERGLLHVRQALSRQRGGYAFTEPKSTASRRVIALPAEVIDALRDLRKRRATIDPDALLFAQPSGKPIRAKALRADFRKIAKAAGLPAIRIHDARHSHLSFLARAGVPLQVLASRAGHASRAFTANTYLSDLPDSQDVAAQAVSRMLASRAK